MDKRKQNLINIYKSMDKALKKLIESNAKGYLKPFKNKPWYRVALKEYKDTSKDLLGILNGHAKAYGKAIEEKELFNKKVVKKHDDNDDIDDISEDNVDYDDVVDKDTQNILEEIKEKIIEELEEFFGEDIQKDLILVAAKDVAKDLGIKFNFNKFDLLTRDYLRGKKISWAKQVAETTEKRIKELLVQGFEEGLGSYDIVELIYQNGIFNYNRAEIIARTEIIGSCNYADNTMWGFDENIIGKEWSSTGDGRDRMTHSSASGQKVPKNKPFIIGGYQLMHPGDSSLGAPAGEIINCRCTMFPIFKGESLKSNTIYDEKDVGTVEWLKRQEEGFQEEYLGGKNKRIFLQADLLDKDEFQKSWKEIRRIKEEKGIIFVDKECMDHSTLGEFAKLVNPRNPLKGGGKMQSGGHSQKNILFLDELYNKFQKQYKDIIDGISGSNSQRANIKGLMRNYTYEYKTYSNGIRVGNIIGHGKKEKREKNGQSWFPKDWNSDIINIIGLKIANEKDKNKYWISLENDNMHYKHAIHDNVEVVVCYNKKENRIDSIFPAKYQTHLEKEGEKLYDK